MTRLTISTSLVLCMSIAGANPMFPMRVVDSQNLQPGIYSNPAAILGPPSTWVRDTSPNGGPNQRVPVVPGYSAWNVAPNGDPLLVGLGQNGRVTVEFSPPLRDDPRNWYGLDFMVFGNAFIAVNQAVTWQSNLDLVTVISGPDWVEPMSVSVSPDGFQWYTYAVTPFSGADGYWPTAAFQWNGATSSLGATSRWDKPVPPQLARPSLNGMSVAQVIAAYQGSAGGTAFDLAETGFRFVRFIRISGTGGEIDAISRVSPTPIPTTATRIP